MTFSGAGPVGNAFDAYYNLILHSTSLSLSHSLTHSLTHTHTHTHTHSLSLSLSLVVEFRCILFFSSPPFFNKKERKKERKEKEKERIESPSLFFLYTSLQTSICDVVFNSKVFIGTPRIMASRKHNCTWAYMINEHP